MTDQRSTAVARVKNPGQLAAAVPLLLGFPPTESLVVLCQKEPRGRVVLTFRVDLPTTPAQRDALVEMVAGHVRQVRSTRFSLLVHSESAEDLPHADLVAGVREALCDLRESELLLVRDGRWWSYACRGACCPPEGTPIADEAQSEPVTLVAAERVLRGEVLAGSREELAASLAGPSFLAAAGASQRCDRAMVTLADDVLDRGAPAAHARVARLWDTTVARFGLPGAQVDPDDAALLAASLQIGVVRDHLGQTPEHDRPAAIALLAELVRRTPEPYDGAVCASYGWLAYLEGGGAMVTIALERALASDPTHPLVTLLDEVVTRAVPPSDLLDIWQDAGRRLTA